MALLTLLLAPLAALAGMYEAHEMEIGAALELQPNGHFRYQFDYGAVSEQAAGDWAFDGKIVRLTSRPMPTPPSFELIHDDPAPTGQISVTLEPPGFGDDYPIPAIATDARTGNRFAVRSSGDGRVDTDGRTISAIELIVPVYGMTAGRFELSPSRGHRLMFRFRANDLGNVGFSGEPLALTDGKLVIIRYDREIRFIRVQP